MKSRMLILLAAALTAFHLGCAVGGPDDTSPADDLETESAESAATSGPRPGPEAPGRHPGAPPAPSVAPTSPVELLCVGCRPGPQPWRELRVTGNESH